MAKCCNDNLSKIFCNTYNKYYNTLYANGEISKKETENLLVISYIRKLFINPRYINYRPILIKALRCIADRSCLLDSSELYGRLDIKTVGDKFVTIQMRDIYSVKIEETDPTVPLYVKDIKQSDITNWNNKLSLETDPVFSASPAATITDEDINNWNNPSASGALIVTVTLDGTYSADATFQDILTAWNNGLDIIVYYSDAIYQVSWIDDGGAWFFRTDKTNAGPYVDYFAVDGTDDSWTKNTYNLLTRLTFDNNPTQGSNNPVKSSGIYNMCPIIEEDTRSASTAAITASAPFASLVDGQRIVLKFKESNAANSTLTLTLSNNTTTSAIPLYFRGYGGSKKPPTGMYVAGCYVCLIYDSTNARWMATNTDYDFSVGNITQAELNAGTSTGARAVTPKIFHDNAYIVEETYTSGSLKANKMYDFGEVTTALTIPDLDATNDLVSDVMNFWALHFVVGTLTPAGTTELSITFPQNPSDNTKEIIVDDEPTIKEGDYVEIMITKHTVSNVTEYYASIKVWQAQSQNS